MSLGTKARSIAFVACALALSAVPGLGQKVPRPSQREISRELQDLYESDQKDQNDESWNEATGSEFDRRQTVRRDRVMEIIEAGMLADLRDWDCAAMLLQHGDSADDYLLAHILSMPCGIAAQTGGVRLPVMHVDETPDFFAGLGTPVAYLVDADRQVVEPIAIGAAEVPDLVRRLAGDA